MKTQIFVCLAFECKGEGFQPHTTSCKKYYWCLDTPSQGTFLIKSALQND